MKDYLNQELSIDDDVIFIEPGYRNFITGIIVGFTPQKVKIEYSPLFKKDEYLVYRIDPLCVIKRN